MKHVLVKVICTFVPAFVLPASLLAQTVAVTDTMVIGYGTACRSEMTGSISSLDGETLRAIPAGDIAHALEGRVAGVEVVQTGPAPSMQLLVRGRRPSSSGGPLIILDGLPFAGSLSDISPSDIRSIEVLKDAAATAVYGSRGADGVILITTCRGEEGQDARVSFNAYTALRHPGPTRNFDLSVVGGTRAGSYRFGTSYYKDPAVIPDRDFSRLSLTGSLDQRVGKWFSFGFTTFTGYIDDGTRSGISDNIASVRFDFPWIKGLSYKLIGGLNHRSSRAGSSIGVETRHWTVENLLTYDRTFAGKHHLNAVALYSAEQTTACGDSYWQSGLLSCMGRVMYTYAGRYVLSVVMRSDASSRLAPGHQRRTYPAVSVGWNIHREDFMAAARGWLDGLKLRVGYGETSIQSVSPYATLGSLSTTVYNFGDEKYATGYYVSVLPNSGLGWEYSRTWNYGLDWSVLDGRLCGTVEYYTVDTRGILQSVSLPATAGAGSFIDDIGDARNRGFEFSMDALIIDSGDWHWTAGLNFFTNSKFAGGFYTNVTWRDFDFSAIGPFTRVPFVTLGYSLHRLAALRKAGITNLRVYGSLQTIFGVSLNF